MRFLFLTFGGLDVLGIPELIIAREQHITASAPIPEVVKWKSVENF